MQITQREALDEFLSYIGERGDAKARNVAERTLNRAMEVVWQKHPWRDFLAPTPYELTLVASTRSYGLPDYVGRLGKGRVRNLTTGATLTYVSPDQLQEAYPAAGTSLEAPGRPSLFTFDGTLPVTTQLATAGATLEVLSNDAADTNVRVTVVGLDAFGREQRVSVQLTGTTPVSLGDFRPPIVEFSKAYVEDVEPTNELTTSVGTVSLRTTAAVGLGNLLPDESAREFTQITFYPTPNVTDTIAIPYVRRPRRLRYASDVLPADWWPCLFEYLVLTWRNNQGDTLAPPPASWPALIDLMALENRSTPRPVTRAFLAGR